MSLANKFGIPESLLDAAKKALDEANEYQKKVQAHMAKKGIKSMKDMTPDQKKKFFNELDAMHTAKHEEVEHVEEGSGPKEKQKTPYRDINSPASRAAADKQREEMDKEEKSKKGKKLLDKIAAKNEEVEPVEEAESHQAKTTMKHIKNPTQGEKDASKKMKSGIPGYRDRIAMLHSAKARGALKNEDFELTQEDIDFIASLNQIDEISIKTAVKAHEKMALDNNPEKNRTGSAGDQSDRMLKKMKSKWGDKAVKKAQIKYQGTNENFDLDDFTVEEIEEYMQTEEFAQLDELSKETLGSYIKKRQHDVAAQGAITRQHAVDAEKAKKDNNYSQQRKSNEKSDKAFAKGWKYRQNISKAVDKIVKKA